MDQLRNFWKKALPILKNRYVITVLVFLTWMLFFDRNNVISQYKIQKQLNGLKKDKAYYQEEIAKNEATLQELMTNKKSLEKFAREKYLMKKDDEDIFVLVVEEE